MNDNENILFQVVVVHRLHLVVFGSSLVSIRYRSSTKLTDDAKLFITGKPSSSSSSSGSGHRVREAFRSLMRKPAASGRDFSHHE